ncbi:MAG: VOC family protein [Pseudomonadota bacterium]
MFLPSHYLVRVDDLPQAVADYEAAGFTVSWGSEKATAYNAMIYFESGGFIELFDPPVSSGVVENLQKGISRVGAAVGQPLLTRYNRWFTERGIVDWALESHVPLAEAISSATAKGAGIGKIRNMSRKQADGTSTQWQLANTNSGDLPFVMGPYSPPPTITSDQIDHQNGLRKLTGMVIETPNPDQQANSLSQLFGNVTIGEHDSEIRLEAVGFQICIRQGAQHRYAAMKTDRQISSDHNLHKLVLEV